MTKYLYSLRDSLTAWMDPVVDLNDASAKRAVSVSVNTTGSLLGYDPAHFELYRVGEFDTDTGIVSAYPLPVMLCNLSELVRGD
ncbi:nonstructural protein [Capybara microvirus Cap3_SP_541]|nr:nonstructural protein [Capybara microvirus Cap3_SP_541]